MARSPDEPANRDDIQDVAIAQLYRQFEARDRAMWERFTERDGKLQDRMLELFAKILDTNAMDRVMAVGFNEIADQLHAQLEPLRELAPQRAQLDESEDAVLASLRRALTRPDYSILTEDRPGQVVLGDMLGFEQRNLMR